jgi:hypothetical protein
MAALVIVNGGSIAAFNDPSPCWRFPQLQRRCGAALCGMCIFAPVESLLEHECEKAGADYDLASRSDMWSRCSCNRSRISGDNICIGGCSRGRVRNSMILFLIWLERKLRRILLVEFPCERKFMLRRFSVEVARSKSGVAGKVVASGPKEAPSIRSRGWWLSCSKGRREMSSKPQAAAIKASRGSAGPSVLGHHCNGVRFPRSAHGSKT